MPAWSCREGRGSQGSPPCPPYCCLWPGKRFCSKPGCAFRDIAQLQGHCSASGTFLSFRHIPQLQGHFSASGTIPSFSKALEAAGSMIFPTGNLAPLGEVTFVGSSPSLGRGPGTFLVSCSPSCGRHGGSVRITWEVSPNSEPLGQPGATGCLWWCHLGDSRVTPPARATPRGREAWGGAGWDTADGTARAGDTLGGWQGSLGVPSWLLYTPERCPGSFSHSKPG